MQETISTKELAKIFGVKAQTIRWNLSQYGHYLGLQPLKMPNGFLRWKKNEVTDVLGTKELHVGSNRNE